MYYEKQRGDMCRLHSLNAYFGYKKLIEEDFFNYCDEYDQIIEGLESKRMDGFSEGRCIINYIIDKLENVYTLTIPINLFENSREFIDTSHYKHLIDTKITSFFEFNKTHIWLNKKQDGKWWKIDSLSGVIHINPNIRNNGLIIVFEDSDLLIKELDYYRKLIKNNKINKLEQRNEIYWCNLVHSYKCLYQSLYEKIQYKSKNIEIKLFKDIYFFLQRFIHLYRKFNYNHSDLIKNINILYYLIQI
tara:strand:- start:274 stop:1011 length:738 start_codon:yes stop_codon:yes gene_type:complete